MKLFAALLLSGWVLLGCGVEEPEMVWDATPVDTTWTVEDASLSAPTICLHIDYQDHTVTIHDYYENGDPLVIDVPCLKEFYQEEEK